MKVTGLALAYSSPPLSCAPKEVLQVNLIPKPVHIEVTGGYSKIDSNLILGNDQPGMIRYVVDEPFNDGNPEGYAPDVAEKGTGLRTASKSGLFYGEQTLCQLYTSKRIPCVSVQDNPRFPYHGLHPDVSHHFFPKGEVMRSLNITSYYKLNTLHMHLADAGGWRIQMDRYPRLTTDVASRMKSDWQRWQDGKDRKYLLEGTSGICGNYFTKGDIREIVDYTTARRIDIIPGVEFPGHSDEVFVAYPELSCAGKPYMTGDFYIGNEELSTFMEDVLSEVIELFPPKYIHIGGDEVGKGARKACPKCQGLIRRNGMKDVDELRSYMIHRAERFLIFKDRKLISWDEILGGDLVLETIVMSRWGEKGGIKSARMGHDVVMTPGGYMYFGFHQVDPGTQPYAIGGYTPAKWAYNYSLAPMGSLTAGESKHVLGAQANAWTEYTKDEKHLEYIMFPRVLTVAEIGWTLQEDRSWKDFKSHMSANIPILQRMGIYTFTLSDEIETTMEVDTLRRGIKVMLDTGKYPAEVRYTTDGPIPTTPSRIYDGPIVMKDSTDIKAAILCDGQLQGTPTKRKVDYHRGINKPIHYNSRLHSDYIANGMDALLDDYRGDLIYPDGRWQGYLNGLDCVVDMGEVMDVHKVSSHLVQLIGPGVYQSGEVELLTSKDRESYISQGIIPTTISNTDKDLSSQEYTLNGDQKARYTCIKAEEANKGFVFTDEIVIR